MMNFTLQDVVVLPYLVPAQRLRPAVVERLSIPTFEGRHGQAALVASLFIRDSQKLPREVGLARHRETVLHLAYVMASDQPALFLLRAALRPRLAAILLRIAVPAFSAGSQGNPRVDQGLRGSGTLHSAARNLRYRLETDSGTTVLQTSIDPALSPANRDSAELALAVLNANNLMMMLRGRWLWKAPLHIATAECIRTVPS